jgi:hypothetical protein
MACVLYWNNRLSATNSCHAAIRRMCFAAKRRLNIVRRQPRSAKYGRVVDSESRVAHGLIVGSIFGVIDLVISWLAPVKDDTAGALVQFYGPMFAVWAFASLRAAHQQRRFLSGVVTGAVVAFATFCAFVVLNLIRVNLFLDQLTDRADWQNIVARFHASEGGSLRVFVTLDYVMAVPLKISAACVVGAAMGAVGAALARLRAWLSTVAA